MGTRRIKQRHRRPPAGSPTAIEYYQMPFNLLHRQLFKSGVLERPHPARASYWTVVPPGRYSPDRGRELLLQYRSMVERQLANELTQHSVAYWLHSYRRLSPGPAGENDDPATISIVRAVMDAAIQKYGTSQLCDGIAWSNQV